MSNVNLVPVSTTTITKEPVKSTLPQPFQGSRLPLISVVFVISGVILGAISIFGYATSTGLGPSWVWIIFIIAMFLIVIGIFLLLYYYSL